MIYRVQKGFTLIELMISIMLLGMVITFLLSTLGGLRINSKALRAKNDLKEQQVKTLTLLQHDIITSTVLQILESDNYVSIELQTSNSLYGINSPYVRWFVDPKKKLLIRSESSKDYVPPFDTDKLFEIHLDVAAKGCDWFKAYLSKDHKSILIGQTCEKRPLFLEVAIPQYKDSNNTKSQTASIAPELPNKTNIQPTRPRPNRPKTFFGNF